MSFTANDVKVLREKTGCGMMECKKALTEANGDAEKAAEILREKGLGKADKKAGRIAAEGVVDVLTVGNTTAIIEVNAETDFVAKNEKFVNFVKACADTIVEKNPADVEALLACEAAGSTDTIDAMLKDNILVIGENMKVRRFARLEGDCVSYVHGGGRIGVLVRFEASENLSGTDALVECGKDVAMQIAALNPLYLDEASVPAEDIAKEKEILIAQIKNDPKNAKKPENIIEKMVEGRIRKFYETNCLTNQAFVKDGEITVAKYIENVAKANGGELKLVEFVRFEKGEGLEKRADNFADEVASMVK